MTSLYTLFSGEALGLGANANYDPLVPVTEPTYTIDDLQSVEEIASLESTAFGALDFLEIAKKSNISMESKIMDFLGSIWKFLKKIIDTIVAAWGLFMAWVKSTFSAKGSKLRTAIGSDSFEDTIVATPTKFGDGGFAGNALTDTDAKYVMVPNLDGRDVEVVPKLGDAIGYIYDANIEVFEAMLKAMDRYSQGKMEEGEDIPKEIVSVSNKYRFTPRTNPDDLFFDIIQNSNRFDTKGLQPNYEYARLEHTEGQSFATALALSIKPTVPYDGQSRQIRITKDILKSCEKSLKLFESEIFSMARHTTRYQGRMDGFITKLDKSIRDEESVERVRTMKDSIKLVLHITRRIGRDLGDPKVLGHIPQLRFVFTVSDAV